MSFQKFEEGVSRLKPMPQIRPGASLATGVPGQNYPITEHIKKT